MGGVRNLDAPPQVTTKHQVSLIALWFVLFSGTVLSSVCWVPSVFAPSKKKDVNHANQFCLVSVPVSISLLVTSLMGLLPMTYAVIAALSPDRELERLDRPNVRLYPPVKGSETENTPLIRAHRSPSVSAASAKGLDGARGAAEFSASRVRRSIPFLYVGHFFSSWSDRMWEFLVPVVFMDIFVDTLWPSALYGLSIYGSTVLLMPVVGFVMDRSRRWNSLIYSIILENISLAITTILLAYLMVAANPEWSGSFVSIIFEDSKPLSVDADGKPIVKSPFVWSTDTVAVFVIIIAVSVFAELNNQAQTIAIEKDWVCVLAQVLGAGRYMEDDGSDEDPTTSSDVQSSKYGTEDISAMGEREYLLHLNRTLRRIDLTCKVLAPAAVGILLQFGNAQSDRAALVTILVITLWNLVAFPIECICHSLVYHLNEDALQLKAHLHESGLVHLHVDWEDPAHHHLISVQGSVSDTEAIEASRDRMAVSSSGPVVNGDKSLFSNTWNGIKLYFSHQILLASIAYCLLYGTILDGGAIVTAYLRWADVSPVSIALSRGTGALFGLLGTVYATWLQRVTGSITRAGLYSIWTFWFLILPAFISFLFTGETASTNTAYCIMGSMVFSRVGLWAFDLLETQLLQEWVEEQDRGKVNAMQVAMSQLSYVAIQVFVLKFDDPSSFYALVDISTASVLLASVLFTIWYLRYDEGAFNVVDEHGSLKLRVRG